MNIQHNIIEVIQERRLRWFRCFKRSNKILKMILEWNAEDRRRKKKLRKSGWME